MRKRDKIRNIKKANLLTEQRHLESKGYINENYSMEDVIDNLNQADKDRNGNFLLGQDLNDLSSDIVGFLIKKAKDKEKMVEMLGDRNMDKLSFRDFEDIPNSFDTLRTFVRHKKT